MPSEVRVPEPHLEREFTCARGPRVKWCTKQLGTAKRVAFGSTWHEPKDRETGVMTLALPSYIVFQPGFNGKHRSSNSKTTKTRIVCNCNYTGQPVYLPTHVPADDSSDGAHYVLCLAHFIARVLLVQCSVHGRRGRRCNLGALSEACDAAGLAAWDGKT